MTFLRRSESTLLTPVVSRFRFFNSAFKSMTLRSDNFRTSAFSGSSASADGFDMIWPANLIQTSVSWQTVDVLMLQHRR